MKEQIIQGIKDWGYSIIDGIAPNNMLFALLSSTLKRGVANMVDKYVNVEAIEPFLARTDGEIDIVATLREITDSLAIMPQKSYSFNGWKITIGEGAIVVNFPQNELLGMLTDNIKSMRLTDKDIIEIGNYINKQR
jgi:hypothetical protein